MMKTSRFEEKAEQQLLPGIPNEVTLDHITSKLPWRAIHALPSVSRGWQQAIQNRQVYNARARFNSTETLVVVNHKAGQQNFIALYSMRDRCFYFLPSIPDIDVGIPPSSQCVSLDGKVYVLGGVNKHVRDQNVYVLDLVGQRRWKQCASMQKPRADFACGVLDGKIYVFGGFSSHAPVRQSEVYDPKVDAWYPIMPMMSLRWDHHVAAVGEELCVHGGGGYDSDLFDQGMDIDYIREALSLEVYHPVRDEWRKVDNFRRNPMAKVFVARGKFYSMTRLTINVHDTKEGSWTHLHSFSFESLGPADSVRVEPNSVLAVGNELLVIVHWYRTDNRTSGVCLLRSRGFGSENETILWDKVNHSLLFGCFPVMYPVQL